MAVSKHLMNQLRILRWGMPAFEITFAELMRAAGYQTACIGKWDVANRQPIIA